MVKSCERFFQLFFHVSVAQSSSALSVTLSGGAGPDHPLHHEAATDNWHDGVLPGGPEGKRPQWFPAGIRPKRRIFFEWWFLNRL